MIGQSSNTIDLDQVASVPPRTLHHCAKLTAELLFKQLIVPG